MKTLFSIFLAVQFTISPAFGQMTTPGGPVTDEPQVITIDPIIIDKDKPVDTTVPDTSTPTPVVVTPTPVAPGVDTTIMPGTPETMVPGILCPLVDGRPRLELVVAAQSLAAKLPILKQCKNNAEVETIQNSITSIIASGASLTGILADPDSIKKDPAKLANLTRDVTNLIGGIDTINNALVNNTLANKSCAGERMGTAGILLGLADLVQAATPLVMTALSFAPQATAVALPFIIGLNEIGSVAKVLKSVHDQNSIDMSRDENRLAILQNVCEFTRIVQRTEALRDAKMGNFHEATDNLSKLNKARQTIASMFSNKVLQLAAINNKITSSLGGLKKTADKDERDLVSTKQQINPESNEYIACTGGKQFVKRFGKEDQLPTRALVNFAKVLELQKSVMKLDLTVSQETLLATEEELRKSLLADTTDMQNPQAVINCAKRGASYVEALSRLVAGTKLTIRGIARFKDDANLDLDDKATSDEYQKFQNTDAAIVDQINRMTAVQRGAEILKFVGEDNGVLDDAEIDVQLRNIKNALFGSKKVIFGLGESPVLSWLNFFNRQSAISRDDFSREVGLLKREAFNLTKSARSTYRVVGPDGRERRMGMHEINDQLIKDLSISDTLQNINLNLVKEGTEAHQKLCTRTKKIWNYWRETLNSVAAQEFVCLYIKDELDTTVESGIRQRCVGYENIKGDVLRRSELADLKDKLAKGYSTNALLIYNKHNEMNCSANLNTFSE